MQKPHQTPSISPASPHRSPPGPRPTGSTPSNDGGARGGPLPVQNSPVSTYWATLRLADALTQDRLETIRAEAEAKLPDEGGTELDRRRRMAQGIETALFAGHGDCWLRDEEIARMVQSALLADHGRRYTLRAWTILPNHLVVVFSVVPGVDPGSVIREWKSFTTRQANLVTGRGSTDFWERSSFIRPCADDAEVVRRIRSVEFRAVNAGLCRRPRDWVWSSANEFHGESGVVPKPQ
jgi:hypothetical protein